MASAINTQFTDIAGYHIPPDIMESLYCKMGSTDSGRFTHLLSRGGYLRVDKQQCIRMALPPALNALAFTGSETINLRVEYLAPNQTTRQDFGWMCMKHLSFFYRPTERLEDPISGNTLLRSYFGLLATLVQATSLQGIRDLSSALLARGYQITWVPVDAPKSDHEKRDDLLMIMRERSSESMAPFGSDELFYSILFSRDISAAIVGPFLMLYAKSITSDARVAWFQKRMRGFGESMGVAYEDSDMVSFVPPEDADLRRLNSLINANHELRRQLFLIFYRMQLVGGRFQNLFRTVITLSRGLEMNHLLIIDEMLFLRFPELLKHKYLASGVQMMEEVYNQLARFPAGERYFLKILYDQQFTTFLNRNNFSPMYEAAHMISCYLSDTFQNMRGGLMKSSVVNDIRGMITEYFGIKNETSMFSIMDAQRADIEKYE